MSAHISHSPGAEHPSTASDQAEERAQACDHQSQDKPDATTPKLLPYCDCLTLINARVQVVAENLENLTLDVIPAHFFALENRATALLEHLESSATAAPVPPPHQNPFQHSPPVVPFEDSLTMLQDPCFSHLTRLTVEQSISRLLTSVTDVQESIQTLASESLPERFDTLERTWAQIEGIISRFKLPPGIPHSAGESTHTRSPNDISTVPRAHSLVFFSQELNSTIFEAATLVISKFSDVLGGLSPLEMDLIRSAPTTGAGTYKDKLAKLTTLETELISHVISTMGPTQLLNVDNTGKLRYPGCLDVI
ncbi:hypothetical protein PTTG_29345 [Puccinia triticina 1-1 BBBD Race 1]|uniref:Uncharacterized protein n=1 Tax=Puccinia triticina (isolate 1-1 / race 1 (BBBD)) TaxID=630390 RepID=A0A180G5A4_PUCT1|nr:hypothetical protein PTTG_29345 [Puccinia triticina 1-1 BBBD Race 1]